MEMGSRPHSCRIEAEVSSQVYEEIITRQKQQPMLEFSLKHWGNLVFLSTPLANNLRLGCGVLMILVKGSQGSRQCLGLMGSPAGEAGGDSGAVKASLNGSWVPSARKGLGDVRRLHQSYVSEGPGEEDGEKGGLKWGNTQIYIN